MYKTYRTVCQAYALCDWCTCHNYLDEMLWCRLLLMTLSVSSNSRALYRIPLVTPVDFIVKHFLRWRRHLSDDCRGNSFRYSALYACASYSAIFRMHEKERDVYIVSYDITYFAVFTDWSLHISNVMECFLPSEIARMVLGKTTIILSSNAVGDNARLYRPTYSRVQLTQKLLTGLGVLLLCFWHLWSFSLQVYLR